MHSKETLQKTQNRNHSQYAVGSSMYTSEWEPGVLPGYHRVEKWWRMTSLLAIEMLSPLWDIRLDVVVIKDLGVPGRSDKLVSYAPEQQ